MADSGVVTLSLANLSKLLDVTPRRVQQLAKDGVIPAPERGKYELIGSVQGYVKFLRARAVGVELGSEAFTQERARKTKAAADMAEIELARMRGTYLHVEEVRMAWTAIVQNVKTRLLVIPSKLGARLLTVKTALAVEEALRDEITEALSELSRFNVTALPAASGSAGHLDDARVRAAAEADDI